MSLKKTASITLAIAITSTTGWADTFGVGPNEFNLDFVNIGNAGNAWDTHIPAAGHAYNTAGHGFGQVNYGYRIGQFEVTIDQFAKAYAADNNISNNDEGAAWGGSVGVDAPATRVTWHEAAKFCNWLTTGSASSGAYNITGGFVTGIDRASAIASFGTVYVIPTEDEWYKAAYFDANGANGYSLYANGTDVAPTSGTNNYFGATGGFPWMWAAGTSPIAEQNGTEDMMGNAFEWNESSFLGDSSTTNNRVARGGWYFSDEGDLKADGNRWDLLRNTSADNIGFRVAAIPEPGTISLMSISTVSLFLARTIRRRKRLGSSLLPVRRESLCDVFESADEYQLSAEVADEWSYLDHIQEFVVDKCLACWNGIAGVYSSLDKKFWNRMVVRYEVKKAKRLAFRASVRKKALAAFDAFLAKIMK